MVVRSGVNLSTNCLYNVLDAMIGHHINCPVVLHSTSPINGVARFIISIRISISIIDNMIDARSTVFHWSCHLNLITRDQSQSIVCHDYQVTEWLPFPSHFSVFKFICD